MTSKLSRKSKPKKLSNVSYYGNINSVVLFKFSVFHPHRIGIILFDSKKFVLKKNFNFLTSIIGEQYKITVQL